MGFEVHGPPADWIAEHGRPARATREENDGLPAYESGITGALLILENLVAFEQRRVRVIGTIAAADRGTLLFPLSYQRAAARSVAEDHELTALHDSPDAVWSWRPLVYSITQEGLTRFGSQMELEWRWGLMEACRCEADLADLVEALAVACVKQGKPYEEFAQLASALATDHRGRWERTYEMGKANVAAEELLLEHLNPQQRLDYRASRKFYARGTINRLYQIELGNGAAIVHPETLETQVSLCLHPERWLPDADVALATKLLIESGPAGEEEMLEGARPNLRKGRTVARELERVAWKLERNLLPAQRLAEV